MIYSHFSRAQMSQTISQLHKQCFSYFRPTTTMFAAANMHKSWFRFKPSQALNRMKANVIGTEQTSLNVLHNFGGFQTQKIFYDDIFCGTNHIFTF